MNNENLLEEAGLEEQWDIACLEFPNGIFSYKKWIKKIGYLREAGNISKFLYKPSLLSVCNPEKKPSKCYIAVKDLRLPTDERQAKNILHEIKSLMILEERTRNAQREINIIRLFGYRRGNECYQLYMEWMDFSLKDFYTKGVKMMQINRIVTEEINSKLNTLIGYITVEIIDALCELVSCEKPIIHRDVKPENILLSYRGKVKLADFGEARFENTRTTGGTPRYRPPEAFIMHDIGEDDLQKYDVFSLGVVVLEYFCGMHPYDYIKEISHSRYLNDVVLVELGALIEVSEENSIFIEDENFRNFLSLSLRPIETRATPLELQQTDFYTTYKIQNSHTRIAMILSELEIHSEPSIISPRQTNKSLPFIKFGFFALLAICLIISATIFFIIINTPSTECEHASGTCMDNYTTGCETAERMIMPFSCFPKYSDAKCCVDTKKKAKIDSPKWQNNCDCEPDEVSEDSNCIDEVPPGTKKLEEELNANFLHLIKTSSNYEDCGPETPQSFKVKRAINIHIFSGLGKEKKRAVENSIYTYLINTVNATTPCNTGIEEIIYREVVNERTKMEYKIKYIWRPNLPTPLAIPGHQYRSHITIILNSCGSKNWGFANIGRI